MACGFRISHHRNVTRNTAKRTNDPTILALLQPSWLASINPYVTKKSAAVPRTSPRTSSCRSTSETDSVTVRTATISATIPIGTFKKKTDCQPRRSTMYPPSVGPRARAIPETPAQMPSAFARSFTGKVTVKIESVPGIRRAPPTPCNARNAISWVGFCETPQRNENTVKTPTPARNIFFRPYRSPMMPPVSNSDANART
jgi:hypothetical protein